MNQIKAATFYFIKAFILFLLLIFYSCPLYAQNKFLEENYNKKEYRIKMRDGVKLFTAVYSPKDDSIKYPIIIWRTPYSSGPYGEDKQQ